MQRRCMVLGIFLTGPMALAQQTDRTEIGRLEAGAIVSFVRAPDGQWGVEVAGGAAPKIVQAKPVNLEVYRSDQDIRQLGTGYKTVEKADNRIEARADIAYEGNVVFRVEDRWSVKGAVLSLERQVGVTGSAPGGFSSSIVFGVDPSEVWTDVNCLAPGLLYGDPTYDGDRSPGGKLNYAARRFVMREDILAAPLFALSFKNGASVSVLDPAPRGDTTAEETKLTRSAITDARLQFGALGAWQADDSPIEFGFRFPATTSDYMRGPGAQAARRRRRRLRTGIGAITRSPPACPTATK